MAPVLNRVEITPEANYLVVQPVWEGVDRPITGGTAFPLNKLKLAQRWSAALESGKAWYKEPVICTDCDGETYVSAFPSMSPRTANADLKRLGF